MFIKMEAKEWLEWADERTNLKAENKKLKEALNSILIITTTGNTMFAAELLCEIGAITKQGLNNEVILEGGGIT